MKTKLTAPQAALLTRLPEVFTIFEDRAQNNPPTIVRDAAGRDLFRFGPGEGRAFQNLWQGGRVQKNAAGVFSKAQPAAPSLPKHIDCDFCATNEPHPKNAF